MLRYILVLRPCMGQTDQSYPSSTIVRAQINVQNIIESSLQGRKPTVHKREARSLNHGQDL